MPPLLLLFDIDGTLVRSRPLTHQRAMARAAVEVLGLPSSTDENSVRAVEPWGKTDRWILEEVVAAAGRNEPLGEDELARWERAACAAYVELENGSPDADDVRHAAVLAGLRDEGHDLALVTGNLEPIARRKLSLRGLGDFFPEGQGGFGSDARDRAELVHIARRRAGDRPADETALIGDTPLDVAAALSAGVRAVGVAGSRYSVEDLLRAGAWAAVRELDELPALL